MNPIWAVLLEIINSFFINSNINDLQCFGFEYQQALFMSSFYTAYVVIFKLYCFFFLVLGYILLAKIKKKLNFSNC